MKVCCTSDEADQLLACAHKEQLEGPLLDGPLHEVDEKLPLEPVLKDGDRMEDLEELIRGKVGLAGPYLPEDACGQAGIGLDDHLGGLAGEVHYNLLARQEIE